MKKFNWFSLLSLIPLVVAGIEKIHGDSESGATKKQMAMDALDIATVGAQAVTPDNTAAINAASQLTSNVIDGVVAFNNATGLFQKKATSTTVTVKK